MGYGRSQLIILGVAMRALKSTLPLFFILGLISGTVCWALQFVLPETQWIVDYYPGAVLGIFLYVGGAYVAGMNARSRILALIISIAASILGWRLAVQVGYDLGGPVAFVNAGTLGALVLALGLLFGWHIRAGAWKFVLLVTVGGALGGLVFHFLDQWFIGAMENDDIWILILFAEWQSIFMAGLALALHYGVRK
jgi:hypothetical protein